jgi:hypothetical protein
MWPVLFRGNTLMSAMDIGSFSSVLTVTSNRITAYKAKHNGALHKRLLSALMEYVKCMAKQVSFHQTIEIFQISFTWLLRCLLDIFLKGKESI